MLSVEADAGAVAVAAAAHLTSVVEAAIDRHGSAVISLTGGQTPRRLYSLLADAAYPWRNRIDWRRLHVFWGDERHVPPDHRDSNFGMAFETLLRHVPIPPAAIHRMRGELPDAHDAAREYDAALRAGFAAAGRRSQTFDLMLLGLGEDAHIASIFPGSSLLEPQAPSPDAAPAEPQPLAAAVWAAHLGAWRITLTPPALLDADAILMVLAGESKADAVQAALEGPDDVVRWPAQLLRRADARVTWIADRPAAARLRRIAGGH
jgi:6-phosphogluconolactonase